MFINFHLINVSNIFCQTDNAILNQNKKPLQILKWFLFYGLLFYQSSVVIDLSQMIIQMRCEMN